MVFFLTGLGKILIRQIFSGTRKSDFKDTINKKLCFHVVYCYMCSNCNVTFYGKNCNVIDSAIYDIL